MLALAGSRAKGWPLTVGGLLVTASTSSTAAMGVAVAATAGALMIQILGVTVARSTARIAGSLAGAVLAQALLRGGSSGAFAFGAAVLGVVVIVVAGWRRAQPSVRRRSAVAAVAVGFVAALATAGYAWAVLPARADVLAAQRDADAGVAAGRTGDLERATTLLRSARHRLDRASHRLAMWPAQPILFVPIAAQHARAVDQLVATASDAVDTIIDGVLIDELDQMKPRAGRIDLEAVATYAASLRQTARQLARVPTELDGVRSPWLVPAVEDGIDELTSLARIAQTEASSLADTAEIIPSMLGGDGERRWFLAVLTPSELRGAGGFMGNWGVITANNGKLELSEAGRSTDLRSAEGFDITVDDEFDHRYVEAFKLDRFPGNTAASPHFPSSARAMLQLATQAGIPDLDGVIAIDPLGLAALLRVTGPVESGQLGRLDASNVGRRLLYEQYRDPDAPGRPDGLVAATKDIFDAALSRDLPAPNRIAEALGPAVDGRHIQIFSTHGDEQGLMVDVGVDGGMRPVVGDAIGLIVQDATPSKLDWFLRRRMSYDVAVDARTGDVRGAAVVRLENRAPLDLPGSYLAPRAVPGRPASTNRMLVSLFTALDVDHVTVDGTPVEAIRTTEQGRNVYDVFVVVDPGATAVLRYAVHGQVPAGSRYRLDVHRQPTVAPDRVDIRVNGQTLYDNTHTEDLRLETRL